MIGRRRAAGGYGNWLGFFVYKEVTLMVFMFSISKIWSLLQSYMVQRGRSGGILFLWRNFCFLLGILISVKVLLGVAWYWISMATIFILSIYTHLAIWMRKENCWQIWWCQDEGLETIGKDFFKEKLKFQRKKNSEVGMWRYLMVWVLI